MKSTISCALALSGALAMTACTSSTSGGSGTPVGSTAAPSPSSSSSVDGAALGKKMAAAMKAKNTAHFTLSAAGTTGTGQIDIAKKAAKVEVNAVGHKIISISVNNAHYVKGILPSGKYVKIDPNGKSALDKSMSSLTSAGDSSDPNKIADLLGRAKGTDEGKASGGEKYHFTIPLSAYATSMKGALGKAITQLKGPITLDLVVGSDNLPVTATSTLKTGNRAITSQVRYTGWGSKVQVSAPPASQIGKLPAGM